jgi:hypothetical protein
MFLNLLLQILKKESLKYLCKSMYKTPITPIILLDSLILQQRVKIYENQLPSKAFQGKYEDFHM